MFGKKMFCNASVARKGHWLFGKRRRQHVCVIQLQIRAPLAPVAGLLFRLRVNTEREGWADVFCLDAQPPDNTQKNMQIYTPTHTVRSDFHSLKNICIYKKNHGLRVRVRLFDLVIATLSRNVKTASMYQTICSVFFALHFASGF